MAKVGRPKKYASNELRLKEYAKRARVKYSEDKDVRDYIVDPSAEKYRGTQAYRMYHGIKTRSKKNNLPFNLDVEFIFNLLDEAKVCPLLDVEFDNDRYIKSVDRKIPAEGYTKENVWIISKRANTIKNDASIEELELITSRMRECGF